MKTAIMNLNNLTVVDHAIIDNDGYLVGGSFNPSFLVEGNIDPVEKVVVDFSTIKKQMKATMDDKQVGFDHKLWIIQHYSKILDIRTELGQILSIPQLHDYTEWKQSIIIKTPYGEYNIPRDAIKVVLTDTDTSEYTIANVGVWFDNYYKQQFPQLNITTINNVETHALRPVEYFQYFSYAHGLKDSTSWGCQNIAHGHLSYIILNGKKGSDANQIEILTDTIATELDRTYFINKENVVNVSNENYNNVIHLKYTSDRGSFSAKVSDNQKQKCIILDSETTIEYLVKYVADTYSNQLTALGVESIIVSEGLSKGAMYYIEDNNA